MNNYKYQGLSDISTALKEKTVLAEEKVKWKEYFKNIGFFDFVIN